MMPLWLPQFGPKGPRPVGRPLLALSDVHGDLDALESVLAAVGDVELCGIVACGDHCLGPTFAEVEPQPYEVWQRLRSLGATMVRGATDLALASPALEKRVPESYVEEAHLERYLAAKRALGDIVCRRLGELPTTAVVSLDDTTTGVMCLHGSPRDPCRGLKKALPDEHLAAETACVAEDVLVTGATHEPFVRRSGQLLVINAGAVGVHQTAHAVLISPYTDGIVRARGRDLPVVRRALRPAV